MRHAAPVAIVNGTLAQRFWGGASNAIGKRVRVADGEWRTIIGVAADIKYVADQRTPAPVCLRAVPAVVSVEHDSVHTGTCARRRAGGSGAGACCRARRRICRSCLPGGSPNTSRGALMLFDLAATMLFVFGVAGMALAAMGTTGSCRTPSSRAPTKSASAWRSAHRAWSVVRDFSQRGLRLGAIGAALGIVAALGVSRLLGERAVRRQRDRWHRPSRARWRSLSASSSPRPSFRPGARHRRIR